LDEAGERYGFVFGELVAGDDGTSFAKEYLKLADGGGEGIVLYEGQGSYETRTLAVRALTRLQLQIVGYSRA
jgi:hypothetical protein